MKAQCAALALMLALVVGQEYAPSPAAASSPAGGDEDEAADAPSGLTCKQLCAQATGIGSSDCMTECQTHTLIAPDKDEALGDFVHDRAYNEASGHGGEAMEDTYEEATGEEIADCVPTFKGTSDDPTPSFADIDTNGDGIVTRDEAIAMGHSMCVSDEMVMQMFTMADKNRDRELTPSEFNSVGEEHAAEGMVDKVADTESEGDQEYNEVKMPPFEEFDKNGDGVLDGNETQRVIVFELSRRFPGKSHEELEEMAGDAKDDLAQAVQHVDTDGDGKITEDEWYADPETNADMGKELGESAKDDENAKDPDDLLAAEQDQTEPPAAAPAPAALFFHARLPFSTALTVLARKQHAVAAWRRLKAEWRARRRGGPAPLRRLHVRQAPRGEGLYRGWAALADAARNHRRHRRQVRHEKKISHHRARHQKANAGHRMHQQEANVHAPKRSLRRHYRQA